MSTICYCGSPLKQHQKDPAASTCFICLNAISKDDPHVYSCKTQQCLYETATGYQYNVCAECYQNNNSNDSHDDNTDESHDNISLAMKKSSATINAISSALFLYL